MLHRRLFGAVVGTALCAGLAAGAAAAGKLTVPIATWGSPSHINIVQFVGPLEEILKRETDGRITVQHFPGGQIAEDADMPVAIPTGKVKMGWITISGWSGSVPDVKIGDAPTGLTMEQMARATDGEGGLKQALDEQFQAKGAKLVAVTDLGPPAIVSSKKIVGPDDLKGVKIRVYSEGGAELMRHLGASPVKMPFADVYTAMQRGTIDAAMIGFQGVQSQRMYEVAKYLLTPAAFLGTALNGYAANLQWWNRLDPADREILAKAIREAELVTRQKIIEDRAGLADVYRDKGMTVTDLTPDMPEYKAWADATAPLMKQAEERLSDAVMEPVKRIMAEGKS